MTEAEIEIIKRDEQQQDVLSAEVSSKSSFVAAIGSLAAFMVLQWISSANHPRISIALLACVAVAFALLFCQAWGMDYLYPALPSEWEKWLNDRTAVLHGYLDADADAIAQAQIEMLQGFWIRAKERTETNRELNKTKLLLLRISGCAALALILTVLALSLSAKAGLF